jgi:Protein of unknown function (DUF2934)
MSQTASTGRAKRSRTSGNTTSSTQRQAPKTTVETPTLSAEQRHAMIAERAYFRAAERGFNGGDPMADWLASERDVDALLSSSS